MTIYLDTCCYGRPYDDPTQIQIVLETIAIKGIIEICRITKHRIVGSMALIYEIEQNTDIEKRNEIKAYFERVINTYIEEYDDERAKALQAEGLKRMDSHHLAIAEIAKADLLLTTDKDFLRVCARKNLSVVRVINPLNFIQEII